MKNLLTMAFLLVATASVWAQTTTVSDNNARVREVGNFSGVKVSAGIELLLQQGDKDAVAVSCNRPEYLDRIKTTVEGNVLKISIDNNYGGDWKWRKKKCASNRLKNWKIKNKNCRISKLPRRKRQILFYHIT